MLDQDKILNFLKVNGPTYPSKVAKNIKTNILLASAHLSDLTRQGKVKISDLKIGASPLYFLTGQEDQLYQFAQGNINPKDYQALEMLHQKKVLRENNLEVLNKVALRGLKDFAVPLHVTIGNNKEVFWKWHLLSDEETNKIISAILFGEAKVREEKPVSEPNAPGQTVLTPVSSPENKIVVEEPVLNDTPAIPEKTSEKETDIVENKKEEEEDKSDKDKKIKEKENKVNKEEKEEKESKKNKDIKSSKEIKDEEIKEMIGSEKENKDIKLEEEEENIEKEKKETELEKVLKNELNEEKENKNNSVNNLKLSKDKIKQKPLLQKIKERISRKKINDKFLPQLELFFKTMDVHIDQKDTIRKNYEMDFLVLVPSVLGKTKYFCKAKSKARCDEKDLSSAYMEAQIKKLPLLFIHTNDLTKKAKEMLDSGAFENTIVKKIES